MTYRALATDYDGTLAERGAVPEPTWAALGRLRASGRRLILVTGRERDDLAGVCPDFGRFDRLVLENGALLIDPSTGSERMLAPPASDALIAALQAARVAPLSAGRAIVATWMPHREAVERAIAGLGLDLRVIPNKRALMILPPGVDKASGLLAALAELGIDPSETVGVGDAENDEPLLKAAGLGVAVANADDDLKRIAGLVTRGERGAGVAELVDRLLAGDLPVPGSGPGRD